MQFITTIPMLTTEIENGAWHCLIESRGFRFYLNPCPSPSNQGLRYSASCELQVASCEFELRVASLSCEFELRVASWNVRVASFGLRVQCNSYFTSWTMRVASFSYLRVKWFWISVWFVSMCVCLRWALNDQFCICIHREYVLETCGHLSTKVKVICTHAIITT